jgi:tetratricopeptide (TPR) repeat protein
MRTLLLAAVCASACGPKTVAPPPPLPPVVELTPLAFADVLRPEVPAVFSGTAAARSQDRGWALLQAGNLKAAARELSATLSTSPDFYPAEIALGHVELARKNAAAALSHFDRALRWSASDRSALLGRGQALLTLGRERDALHTFEVAVAADPSLGDIARNIEVLRFRLQEQTLARARDASRAGRWHEAAAGYAEAVAGSPDSPFLYRELAEAERRAGETDRAIEHLRRAVALDPNDPTALIAVGELLETEGDLEGALTAYRAALALERSAELEARLEALRVRVESARVPDEYRANEARSAITRADLAALIGIRLGALLRTGSTGTALVTDWRSSWAAPWILAVTRAGVMEPFANHAFQPRAVVRRIEFAQTVSRLLMILAPTGSARARPWDSARLRFSDLGPSHLGYVAASQAVASGVVKAEAEGGFQPTRPVTGRQAIDSIARLEALAGASGTTKVAQ